MLSFENSDRLVSFYNSGFNQIEITLNWALDNNSLLNFVYARKRGSEMPEEILATVYVKLPLLQG